MKVSKKETDALALRRHDFHGDWNYTVLPEQPVGGLQPCYFAEGPKPRLASVTGELAGHENDRRGGGHLVTQSRAPEDVYICLADHA